MNIDCIEIPAGETAQGTITGNADVQIVRTGTSAALAAIARADGVTHFGSQAIRPHQGTVHFTVTEIPGIIAHLVHPRRPFRSGDDEAVDRLAAGINRLVHLIKRIGTLRAGVVRGRGPGAHPSAAVGGADVKLDNRLIGPRWQHTAENAVTSRAIAVQTVIQHRGVREARCAIHPEINGGRHVAAQLIHQARRHGDGVGGLRNQREMLHVENDGGDVRGRDGIRHAGGSVGGRAGRPILAVVAGHRRIDPLQRFAAAVRRGGPLPAAPPRRLTGIDISNAPQRPVAFAEIRHTVHRLAEVIRQFDFFPAVGQLADPVANDIGDARIIRRKHGGIRRHDEITLGRKRGVREGELDPFGQLPAGQIHRVGARVEQFDPFLARVFRHHRSRMIHDFIDADLGAQRRGDHGHA